MKSLGGSPGPSDLDPDGSPGGPGQEVATRARKRPMGPANRGPSVSVPACKLSFCFAGFTEHSFISCDCAILEGVNIAGGLFKKANDLKWVFFPPFLFHLNYLQETGPPKQCAVLMCWLLVLTFPFHLVICCTAYRREERYGDRHTKS